MKQINFTSFQLFINDDFPVLSDMVNLVESIEDKYEVENNTYFVEGEIIEDRYIWIYFRGGAETPYSPEVLNKNTSLIEDNPKKITQIELDKQAFVLYDLNSDTLYVSDSRKRGFIQDYFEYIDTYHSYDVKNIYKSVEEFYDNIKTVSELKMVAVSDLFSQNTSIFRIITEKLDFLGFDNPKEVSLELIFKDAMKNPKLIDTIKEIIKLKKDKKILKLSCIGKNDKNMERIFNINNYVERVSISTEVDNTGLSIPKLVQASIIEKIKD